MCTVTAAGETIACRGTTGDGQAITATSTADDKNLLTVTVGPVTLYRGPLQDVLTTAARPSS